MSVQQDDTRSEERPRVAAPEAALGDAAAQCSCTATSLPSPAGEIVVLRVAGEVDLSTLPVLQAALTNGLARRPGHLLVDLAELTFCSAWGLALLVQAGSAAAGHGTGYTVSAVSRHINRVWTTLWLESELPIRYPTATAGVLAARARQADHRDRPASHRINNAGQPL